MENKSKRCFYCSISLIKSSLFYAIFSMNIKKVNKIPTLRAIRMMSFRLTLSGELVQASIPSSERYLLR